MRTTLFSIAIALTSLTATAPARGQILGPYVSGGVNLTRDLGYHPTAVVGGGGLQIEAKHFLATFESFVDDSRKLDSGTGLTARTLGVAFYRPTKNVFLGGGISYSALRTAPYNKNVWHPRAGAGYDHLSESFSIRAQAEYVFVGTDHFNGLQGTEFIVYMPSPRSHAHWIYRETVGTYHFYLTTGSPSSFGTEERFTVMYRF